MTASAGNALASFQKMLATGKDGALLRYSLGNEYMKMGDAVLAVEHLARAVAYDPKYTAAWKLYGKALTAADRPGDALAAYQSGIAAAHAHGDKQAEKEMQVFARRLAQAASADGDQ
jgi:tetratricopeptide (TPR) repeat protein